MELLTRYSAIYNRCPDVTKLQRWMIENFVPLVFTKISYVLQVFRYINQKVLISMKNINKLIHLFPAQVTLLPRSCFAPALLPPCSWSCPPQFGSLHPHQHLTTFFGTARAGFYGINATAIRIELES